MSPLLGDLDEDRRILKRAKRGVVAWRIRSVVLALIAFLFFRRGGLVLGSAFVVLAAAAWQISRYTVRKADELLKKLDEMEKR